MRSQKQLRDDLRLVTEFTTLFDVVQQAAMSQLRRLDEQVGRMPPLMETLRREFLPLLPAAATQHPYLRGGARGRLLVVITSDEGLVGPLHAAVVREARRRAEDASQWLFIGQRGWRMASGRSGQPAAAAHVVPIPPEGRTDEQLTRVRQFILGQYRANALKDVWLVTPRYRSATHQDVVAEQLLPIAVGQSAVDERELVIEPSLERVVERLAAAWVEAGCREAFWSARRAEYAARAIHVEASRQELARRSRVIRHRFFKALHERMDVLVRETCVVQRYVARRAERRQQPIRIS